MDAQVLDGRQEQALQHRPHERALFLAQPASRGHGALHIKAVGQMAIEDWPKADFEHKEGMLKEKAA